ncbi:MAG: glycoside hydrolase family 10 [Ruminococcaceae bacterium]|nr:glycoside hydrolase family 10 [Oscillospiraceae bacterium]
MSRADIALRYFNSMDEATKLRIASGIELNRKGNCEITVKAKEGELPADITVIAEQTNHEFKFGANIFMLDEFENEEKNKIYREKFPELYNLATVPFYWSDLEPERGKPRYAKDSPKIYRRPAPDLCVEYCKEKGIEPKCHCLNYDNFLPEWLMDATVSEHKAMLEKRFREIAERYAADLPSFEVTNETLQRAKSKFFYEDDFVEWSFRMAERYFPLNRLIINDYNQWWPNHTNRAAYFMQIERLIRKGHRVDSIGFQFHSFFPMESEMEMSKTRYNPDQLFAMMDNYAKLGRAEQITEMTIPAYGADEENEFVQAELMRHVYEIFFSHPAMEAIIYWNLVDGYAAFAPQGDMTAGENKYHGGLLRFDMSEKPAFKVMKQLINEEWHTSAQVALKDGHGSFRGFYGDYKLTVHAGGKAIPAQCTLSKENPGRVEIII